MEMIKLFDKIYIFIDGLKPIYEAIEKTLVIII
jgi:hypothetical protein